MDPTWEFQAPQFVDFNTLGEDEDPTDEDEDISMDCEKVQDYGKQSVTVNILR